MKNIIKKFNQTGDCEIHIDQVIKQWNNRCVLLRWENTFRLVEEKWLHGKNTGNTIFKFQISRLDAELLILKLKLYEEQSFFASSKSYRTAISEVHHVIKEQQDYIKKANAKIRELNKKLKSYGKVH